MIARKWANKRRYADGKDNNGNTSTCTATVTVEDTTDPEALCQDATVTLDATGNASITAAQIDNGSNDACGIASLNLDETAFDCSEVGANTVTLTVTDNNGNTSTCTATVTVEDITDPQALCQDATVTLDATGNGSITAAQIDDGSNDACGIASLSLDETAFDCSEVGANTVTLTVTDNNGNTSTCTATVTVEDTTDPQALCQDITIALDPSGNGSVTAVQIDNGSNDACGIASLSLDDTAFDCSEVGANMVTLTVDRQQRQHKHLRGYGNGGRHHRSASPLPGYYNSPRSEWQRQHHRRADRRRFERRLRDREPESGRNGV
ncbi:MAG: HYR domain-containing protein [Saprospirales bacterium]|nr:HYR domain-containing protein [Saprospirales bacterium]